MNYKKIFNIILLLIITNCTSLNIEKKNYILKIDKKFINKGFTLIYSDSLYDIKKVTKKIDAHSLVIFQKNLKKNTLVKITNILNGQSVLAHVGSDSSYPSFNNSVISQRIANEINLNINEPYIEISSIAKNSSYIAKRAKTFDEEKQVANKAPVDGININDLNKKKIKIKTTPIKKFKYVIKVTDFYYYKSALNAVKRITNETNIKKIKIHKFSNTKYRVYLGPFDNINSLQSTFNDIDILKFENLEIIKND